MVDASIEVTADRIYAALGNGDVVALDPADGTERWRVRLDEHDATHLFSTPTLVESAAGPLLIVGVASIELTQMKPDYTFRGSVVALDPSNGEARWRFYVTEDDDTSGAGVSVWSSVAFDAERDLVFVGTGNTYEEPASPYSDSLLALEASTGDLAWHRQFTEGDVYVVFRPRAPTRTSAPPPTCSRSTDGTSSASATRPGCTQ